MEWEAFAASLLPAATGMSSLALRDHAPQILRAIARDLGTFQDRDQQAEKSKGRAVKAPDAPETAAQTHAVLRARGGFDINQLVAEYRALRASVLRLWIDASALDEPGVHDVIRFNEAIDQAVAESVGHFHAEVERSRNLLLGMLGHDMRSPLATVLATASYLSALDPGEEVSASAARLVRSGTAMQSLLEDLMDFDRAKLGLGVRVAPTDIDLAPIISGELEQLRAAYPGRRIEFGASGDCHGRWDGPRMQRLVRNLVSNAMRYGFADSNVRVLLRGSGGDVRIDVSNHGPAIDPSSLERMFEPLQRGADPGDSDDAQAGLGLGLFIVREIAKAHGGEVGVHSQDQETTFAVRLPRRDRDPSA